MLVLSRKVDESLLFTLTEPMPAGSVIEVVCVRIGPKSVRLGIDAPAAVAISRDEMPPLPLTLPQGASPCGVRGGEVLT